MRQTAILVLLLAGIASATYQECVNQYCSKEKTACELNLTCATRSLKCYNQCGDDPACLDTCFQGFTNAQYLALKNCALKYCVNAFLQTQNLVKCTSEQIEACLYNLQEFAYAAEDPREVVAEFYNQHPECKCL